MSKKLKQVKKMSQLKKGDKVLVVHEPEVVEVQQAWSGSDTVIDGDGFYARYDDDLHYSDSIKVFRLPRK